MLSVDKSVEFISENLVFFREVTVAVKQYEQEVESILRSIASSHEADLSALTLSMEGAVLKSSVEESFSQILLKKPRESFEIGLALQAWEGPDPLYCAYSYIWVREKAVRSKIDVQFGTKVDEPFKYEFESQTSYVSLYGKTGEHSKVVYGIADTFRILLNCLKDSADLRAVVSG